MPNEPRCSPSATPFACLARALGGLDERAKTSLGAALGAADEAYRKREAGRRGPHWARCVRGFVFDVHVPLAAAERGHAVLTSDDGDTTAVGLDLVLVHV
jgi:hypothetical protein